MSGMVADPHRFQFDLDRAASNLETILRICNRPGRILVLMQNNPDPDSLASAAALRDIIAVRLKKRITIGYGGICGRAENRAMITVLRIDAKHVTPAEVAAARTVCLVDSQPRAGNTLLLTNRTTDIVVDHHLLPEHVPWKAEFTDIRAEYGATATIFYEYLLAAGVKISANLGTALFYGIRSDTQDLGREAGPQDIQAFQELFQLAERRKLALIRRAPVPPEYFRVLSAALSTCVVAGNTVISCIPAHASPDMIAEVSDLMLRLQGMRASVCYGICGGVVHISARRQDAHGDIAASIRRVVGRLGSGGGHRTMAGGQIPVAGDPERRLDLVRQRILSVFAPNAEPRPLIAPPPAAKPGSMA